MHPFSYIYSYDAYDNYKYFLKYGDEIVLYIVGIMESNYGEDVRNWEILDETDLADYIKEMDIHA